VRVEALPTALTKNAMPTVQVERKPAAEPSRRAPQAEAAPVHQGRRGGSPAAITLSADAAAWKKKVAARLAEMDQKRLERAAEVINKALRVLDRVVRFERHEATGTIIARIIDTSTDEVIREIPPEKLLDVAGLIMQGLLVDEVA